MARRHSRCLEASEKDEGSSGTERSRRFRRRPVNCPICSTKRTKGIGLRSSDHGVFERFRCIGKKRSQNWRSSDG